VRWRALPDSLDPNQQRLIVRLRQLKDDSGLTLKSLQAKTSFSGSSWARYLNGKALPPAAAVRALSTLAGADPTPLLGLRTATSVRSDQPRIRVTALTLAAGALLASAAGTIALIVWPQRPASAPVADVGRYSCTFTRHGDLLYAGNSTTSSHMLLLNSTGPDVAEAQCLLQRHRLSPGDVDGYLGQSSATAIKRLQEMDHVPADGVVSDQTWALLRHVD
jgi:transcriptional regulator with XRE-family HTH domain